MTIGNIGHQPNPFAWINEGWDALKERAHSAATHFASTEENSEKIDEARSGGSWGVVAVDVSSREGEFEARFELPGLAKEDIEVTVRDGQVIVEGEKHVSEEFRKGDLVVTERAFGRFRRSIVLPGAARAEDASARYENGVLIVTVPRVGQDTPSGKIEIK